MCKKVINRFLVPCCVILQLCIIYLSFDRIYAEDSAQLIREINEEYCLLVTDDDWNKKDMIAGENCYHYKDVIVLEYDSEEELQKAYEELLQDGIEVEKNDFFELSNIQDIYSNDKPGIPATGDYKEIPVVDTGIRIAVIDTGYDLASYGTDRIINPTDLKRGESAQDQNGHGTAISRLILENTSNGIYLMPVKITDANGRCSVLDMYMAINYCIESKVDIINISMTAYRASNGGLINEAIMEARNNNIAVIVAAGNGGSDVSDYSPGNCEDAITVSACDGNYGHSSYSNYGSTIDFCSYGELSGGRVGTSFSAAQLTVAFAELMVMHRNLSVSQYEQLMREAAIKVEQSEKSNTYGYGIITIEGLNSLFTSKPCESSILLNGNCLSMDVQSFNNLIKSTPYSTIRRYLLNLTVSERNELLGKETYLSNSKTNFLVVENVTENENSSKLTIYESLYDYLMKNEFETSWHCADSEMTGYYYLTYQDESNNKSINQTIQVRISGLPTKEGNKQGSITLIDDSVPANGNAGYIIEHVMVTSALEKNFIYIAAKARLYLGDVDHYSLVSSRDENSYDSSKGGGGITNIMDSKSVVCTGDINDIEYVNMQVSFYNIGISVSGGEGDTGNHIKMIVTGKKNENSCVYSTVDGTKNGKREVKCQACEAASKTEYLHSILLEMQRSDGTYTDDKTTEFCSKLNMDGTSFKEKYDGNYFASGRKTKTLIKNYENTVYRNATLGTKTTGEKVEEYVLKVPRKRYKVEFDGNHSTAGSMKTLTCYFDQSKALASSTFVRSYKIILYPNGGLFSDQVAERELKVEYKFKGWNTKADGSGYEVENGQTITNLIVAESGEEVECRPDGESIVLFAQWEAATAEFPVDITRVGYELAGWSKTETGEEIFKDFIPEEDTSLYAIWTPSVFQITLNSGVAKSDGEIETRNIYEKYANNYYEDMNCEKSIDRLDAIPKKVTSESIEYTKAVKKSESGVVTETTTASVEADRKWIFNGYYTKKVDGSFEDGYLVVNTDGSIIDDINNAGRYKFFTEDTEVFANWKKVLFINFQSNLTEEDILTEKELKLPKNINFTDGDTLTITCEKPVITDDKIKALYKFKGWSTDVYGNNIVLNEDDKTEWEIKTDKDIVLYAIWDTEFKIVYNGNAQSTGENYVQTGNNAYKNIELLNNTKEYFGANSIDLKYYLSKSDEVIVLNPSTGELNQNETMTYVFMGWSPNPGARAWEDSVYEPGRTYSIEDLLKEMSGEESILELYAVWDAKPVISATDAWIDVKELGNVNEKYIFDKFNIVATDLEKTSNENPMGEMIPEEEVRLIFFQKQEALYYADRGEDFSIQIVYQAKDKAGNIARKPVMIHFVNTEGKNAYENAKVRFISNLYVNSLGEDSVWRTPEYRDRLKNAFELSKSKDNDFDYTFSKEEIREAKEYILSNASDRTSSNKLREFYNRFCRK